MHSTHSLTLAGWLWILSGRRENDARCLVTPLETRPRTLKKRFWARRERNLAPKERHVISPEWEYLRSTRCLLRFGLKERSLLTRNAKRRSTWDFLHWFSHALKRERISIGKRARRLKFWARAHESQIYGHPSAAQEFAWPPSAHVLAAMKFTLFA